jgi:hypothetical protein
LLLGHVGVVPLESVRLEEVEEQVYNFHVAELQNYAVGGSGILVHNTNDPPGPHSGRPTRLDPDPGADTGRWIARPRDPAPAAELEAMGYRWDYTIGRWVRPGGPTLGPDGMIDPF